MRQLFKITLILMLALACGMGHASTVVFDATRDKVGDAHDEKLLIMSKAGITLKAVRIAGSRDTALVGTFGQGQRYELNGVTVNPNLFDSRLYITSTVGKMNRIVFTCVGTGDGEVGPGGLRKRYGYTYEQNGHKGTFECNATETDISIYKDVWLTKIEVVLEGVVVPPSISGNELFSGSTTVSLAAGEGAAIYYTTDGSEPTANEANRYTGPFTISKTTTVKAFAVESNGSSSKVEKKFLCTDVNNIAEFQQMPAGTTVTFKNPVTVEYVDFVSPKDIYVLDSTGYMVIKDANSKYDTGQEIPAGFSGTVSGSGPGIALTSVTDLQASTKRSQDGWGWPVEKTEGQINESLVNASVTLMRVRIHDVNGRDFKVGETLTGYNEFDDVITSLNRPGALSDNAYYEFQGIVGYRNGKVVLMPTWYKETERMVNNIAEFLQAPKDLKLTFRNAVTVTYVDQRNGVVYVKDATGYAAIIANEQSANYKNGDVIPGGFSGVASPYLAAGTLNEVTGLQPASGTADASPEEKTESEVSSCADYAYVKVKEVKVHDVNGKNFVMGNGLKGYNEFDDQVSLDSLNANVIYDVTGILSKNGNGVQLIPTKFETVALMVNNLAELAAAPQDMHVTFSNPVTVTYVAQAGRGVCVKDATGYGMLIATDSTGYKNGDVIPGGFMGENPNSLPAGVLNVTSGLQPATETADAAPEVKTVDQITKALSWAYVKLQDVKLSAMGGSNYLIDYRLPLINVFQEISLADIDTAASYDVTGVVMFVDSEGAFIPTAMEKLATKVASIQEYDAIAQGTNVEFTNPVTVTYVDAAEPGSIYVKDGTGYMLIQDGSNAGTSYKNGDVIPAGFKGTKPSGDEVRVLVDVKDLQPATTTAVADPLLIEEGDVAESLVNAYVKLTEVQLHGVNGNDFVIGDGLAGYNRFDKTVSLDSINENSRYDVTGILALRNGKITFQPTSLEEVLTAVSSIAEFNAVEGYKYVKFINPVVVNYYDENNHSLYVKDSTGYMMIYYPSVAYKNGDVIPAGFDGQVDVTGHRRLVAVNGLEAATQTMQADPEVLTESQIDSSMVNAYVKIENVKPTNVTEYEFTIGDHLKAVNFIMLEGFEGLDANTLYDVIGIVGLDHDGIMLMPTEIIDNTFTGIGTVDGSKTVASVQYVNLAGQVSNEPFEGLNIVVTTYTDGSKTATKAIK